jgi:hypothetical protein
MGPSVRNLRHHIVIAALMTTHAALLLVGMRRNFAVVDEAAHVPAGISHWQTGDFSLYRVNPPLGRMLAALPVLLVGPRTTYVHVNHGPGARSEWAVARDFAELNASSYIRMLFLARLPGVVWSLLGALIINRWCGELYGRWAGCFGVALWVFDPTVLAFAQVVTPDIPAAVAGLLATYVFRHYLRRRSWSLAILSGLLLGVSQITKFTMVVLYVIWPVIALAYYLGRREGLESETPGSRGRKSGTEIGSPSRSFHHVAADVMGRAPRGSWRILLQAAIIVLASLDIINLAYFFQDTCRGLGSFTFVSQILTDGPGALAGGVSTNRFRGSWLGNLIIPLPAEYLQGIDVQRKDFEIGLPSYLRGEWRNRGWLYYYLYALAVKEPLGISLLAAWGFILAILRHRSCACWYDELTLCLPVVVILSLVSSQTGFNHHMRYVLPVFPFVAVATAKLAFFLRPDRPRLAILVLALLAWAIISSVRVCPHSMSYFNELAGGPENGHNHLLDSNIDWGQDLLSLKEWYSSHPEARPFGLAYYHFLDPRLVGIEFQTPPLGPDIGSSTENLNNPAPIGPQAGYYALSVNFLRGGTFVAPDGRGGYSWISRRDAFAYFRHFQPIARAGYSIYIYHVTPHQAGAVRSELGLPPLQNAFARPGE